VQRGRENASVIRILAHREAGVAPLFLACAAGFAVDFWMACGCGSTARARQEEERAVLVGEDRKEKFDDHYQADVDQGP